MKHLAIIPDGNRRWERIHSLPPGTGHAQAFSVIERICDWCLDNNVKFLTFFCFSTDNWKRSKTETDKIFNLAEEYYSPMKVAWYKNRGIKVIFQGRRDRLTKTMVNTITIVEEATQDCSNLTLYLLVDWGGQEEIRWAFKNNIDPDTIRPHVDCILRSSGEKRLSNFLTWDSAYAELIFIDEFFPDIDARIMDDVLKEYEHRNKRYGR